MPALAVARSMLALLASVTAITIPHLARTIAAVGGDVADILGPDARLDVVYQDRIPVATLALAWERAVSMTRRRDLPAVAASYSAPDERSLVSFVIANQPRFGDGIERFQRYGATISDAYRWTFVDAGDEVKVMLSPTGPIDRLGWQCHVEFEMLDMVRSANRVTAGHAKPRAIRFLHASPPSEIVAAYTELVGHAPVFGCDRCELVFPASVLELAVPTAKPALALAIERQLAAMLAADELGTAVSSRARAAISELLTRRSLDVDGLARAMAMSRRSLERALAGEGTSATALIEDERKQRALAWLPMHSVDEVAERLGYSDARAFARAFKRWTGVPPSQITGDRR